MRRLLVAALAATLPIAAAGTPAAAAGPRDRYEASLGQPPRLVQPTGRLGHAWSGTPTRIAGTATVSNGELIIEDRPFDDTGADTVPGNGDVGPGAEETLTLPLCSTGSLYRYGDATYPNDAAHLKNAADLVEVRLAADATHYYALFQLQILIDPAKVVVALAINADADNTTGTADFPGFEHVVQLTGDTAALNGTTIEGRVDPEANTFEARIPRSALPDTAWRVTAASGLWNGTAWSAVMDLGWVPDEQIVDVPNCWQDRVQAGLLKDKAYPAVDVSPAALRAKTTTNPPLQRGAMTRLYQPSINLGEGIVGQPRYAQTSSAGIYRGAMQPYTAYIPESYDPSKPNPLIVLLHCLSCNHTTFTWAAWPGLKKLAEDRGAPIVTPLAYGEGGHYEGEAEVDVFDVLADVRARYAIDTDRIYLTGMSMGALGTYRLGSLYPDLWAQAFGVGNYTNPFCVTPSQKNAAGCTATTINYFNLLENFRNIPFGIVNGVLDELTPVTGAREIADRFKELGYAHRYWEFPTQAHNPALHGTTSDLSSPWLGDARRIADPARVTYGLTRDVDRDSADFGIVHDRAYWVRDLRMADDADEMRIDATSGRGRQFETAPYSASGTTDAGQWTGTGLDATITRVDNGNTLSVTSKGASAMTVRIADAGLSNAQPLTVTVDTDRPLALRLDGWTTTYNAPAGRTEITLQPGESAEQALARAAANNGNADNHPATGGTADPLPLLTLAAAALAARATRYRYRAASSPPAAQAAARPASQPRSNGASPRGR